MRFFTTCLWQSVLNDMGTHGWGVVLSFEGLLWVVRGGRLFCKIFILILRVLLIAYDTVT